VREAARPTNKSTAVHGSRQAGEHRGDATAGPA